MMIQTIDLEVTSAEALVELMEQRVEILVMQGDTPLAKVVPVTLEQADCKQPQLTLEDEIARAVSDDSWQTPVTDIDEEALLREILDNMRNEDASAEG